MGKEVEIGDYKGILKEILLHFAEFCEQNNIRYSLAYGTLLGAVRHKGFIPWDDDVDVIMPRADYERFKAIYHSDRYPFLDMTLDKHHPTPMGKVCDAQTFFYSNQIRRSYGLFIDVFVVDHFPTDRKVRRCWQKRTRFLIMVNNVKNSDFRGMSRKRSFLGKIRVALYKLLPVPRVFIQRRISSLMQQYNGINTGLVGITMSRDNPFDTYPADFFEEYTHVEFEGHSLMAIRKYDEWLRICYGDYMQLPPPEKRVGKHSIVAYYK